MLGGFVTRLGFGGMPFRLPLLYQLGLGYPAWKAGLLTMPSALAAMGLKLVSGPVMQRFGHHRVLLGNTVLLGLAMMPFTQINRGATIPALHKAFFTLGAITIASAVTFLGLQPHDGNNISHRTPLPPPRGQLRAESRAELGVETERTEELESNSEKR